MNIINKKYIIINKIGSGSFGSIYKGQNIRTKELVAIKVEAIKDKLKLLKNESNIYQYLNGCDGIPFVKWFGKDENNYYMVINLLGLSLQDLMDKMKKLPLLLILKIWFNPSILAPLVLSAKTMYAITVLSGFAFCTTNF